MSAAEQRLKHLTEMRDGLRNLGSTPSAATERAVRKAQAAVDAEKKK